MVAEINLFNIYSTFGTMISQHVLVFLILVLVWCPQVSGEDACPCVTGSNCAENCTLVNIAPQATSTFTSGSNNNYTITGQAAWVTDGVTSGPCASVSSLHPEWKAEFGQNRTVNRIKIFWEDSQKDVTVSVGGRICHNENSSYTWTSEYIFNCGVPVTGNNLLMYRQPTVGMLNLSLCEVEIYALPEVTSSSMFTSTTTPTPTTSTTLSTPSVASSAGGTETTTAPTTSFVSPTATPFPTSSSTTPHEDPTAASVAITATPTPTTSTTLSSTSVTTRSIASSTVSAETTTTPTTSLVSPTVSPISASSSKTPRADPTLPSGASTVTTLSIGSSTVSTDTTTKPTTSLVSPTVTPIPTSSSKTSHADPTLPSGASTVSGTTIGAIVGVVVLLLIIIVLAVVCRKRIKKKYNPLDAEAKEAGKNQAIVIDEVDQPNSTVFDLNEYRSVELPADPEAEPASITGTSKSHIPSAVSVTDLPNYISERLDSIISTEYSMMPAGLRNTHTYVTATREGNLHKNRYKNLFAYDDSLVPLQKEGGADYINASYIHGFKSPLKFIATQGPMNSTVVDFWRMVWQEGSREIVMLTNLLEQGVHKCHMYWLAKGQRGSFGNINVTQEKAIELAHYTVRIFSLHHRKDDTRREVTQYHFTAWPDHGVATAPSLVSFWRHVKTRSQPMDGQAGPIIVHCSAGVGRTGTYIGLDILMNEALVEEKLNFFMTVLNMREHRLNMVQTQGQYKFLHWAVLEALLCRNTPVMASELPSMLDQDNEEIQEEYKNLEVMMSLQGDQKTDGKPDLTQTGDDLFNPNTTSLPSYHNKKGFLHIGLVKEPSPEELWRVICRNNTVTIITINQTSSDATPKDVGTSLTLGEFQVTLTSAEDVSKGVTEKKLTVKTETMQPFGDSGSGVTSITMYNLDSPSTERYFDKAQLLVLIELLTERQHISGRHPVILQCRDDPRKCSLFAAAVNVVSSLRLEKEVDIYLTVREIQCRNGQPVASLEDYRYLYELASHQLQSTNPFTNN